MIKTALKLALAIAIVGLLASSATAGPILLSDTKMDAVAAGGVDRVEGFVCPVIKTDGVLNSTKGIMIGGGHYSILGPDVMVPIHATNGNGTGTPPGPHSMPGDTDYTAIWAK